MKILASRIAEAMPFARIESLTVRDDAPKVIREAAAAHLREVVGQAVSSGHRVLVIPLLLAYGGIEKGIRERLSGLTYEMASGGLLPDDRFAAWVEKAAVP